MIFLKAWRVLTAPNGKEKIFRIRMKKINWSNNFNEFDIFSPSAWRNYLANDFLFDGKHKLPNFTSDKEKIVYGVSVIGVPKWMREYFTMNNVKEVRVVSLFPGYYEDGTKRNLLDFGQIRKINKSNKQEGK